MWKVRKKEETGVARLGEAVKHGTQKELKEAGQLPGEHVGFGHTKHGVCKYLAGTWECGLEAY